MIAIKATPAPDPTASVDSKLDRTLRRVRKTSVALKLNVVTLRHDGIPDHRTSMKLDATSWDLLDHIAKAEGLGHRDALISRIDRAFFSTTIPLTHLVRNFLQTYCAEEILISLERPPEPLAPALPEGKEPGLARWHEEDAAKAERAAAQTSLPMLRARLLDAARMHRHCAELARENA